MKVLLISNEIFHYRIGVYNYFLDEFSKHNIKFSVLSNKHQESRDEIKFELHLQDFNFIRYKKKIIQIKPDIVILFLHLRDLIIFRLFVFLKKNKIPVIYWNHGIDLQDPDSFVKNFLYKIFHRMSDAIILYSPNELNYLRQSVHYKTFIANNTLNYYSIPVIKKSKQEIKDQLGLEFEKIVLFVSRIRENKRLDMLIKAFKTFGSRKWGLVIVGPGLSENDATLIRLQPNIIYLGAIFEDIKINEIYKMSDILCIPGAIGLSINMAMFWGLPCITTNCKHGPEIYYLKDGFNGFIVNTQSELEEKLNLLLSNTKLLYTFSLNARLVVEKEASMENMFQGFLNAIKYLEK